MDGCEGVTEEFVHFLNTWYSHTNSNSNNNNINNNSINSNTNNNNNTEMITNTLNNNYKYQAFSQPFVLQRLSISGCRNVTPQALQELKERCVQLQVVKLSLYERLPREIIAKTVRLAQSYG